MFHWSIHLLKCFWRGSRDNQSSAKTSKGKYISGRFWKHLRNRIASQLSLNDIIEKQLKYLGEGSILEKEHLQKLPRGISVVTHFFSLIEALTWKLL